MVRGRVAATVAPEVERAVRLEQTLREKAAIDAHQPAPVFAHTVEDILKRGLQDCVRARSNRPLNSENVRTRPR
jgi:lipopolysaccharide biosynthesis regulator YciM